MAIKQRKDIIAVLDIGSYKIACLIAKKEANGEFTILGQGYQFSEGIRHGTIVDLEAAEAAILATIDEVEQNAEIKISSMLVNLSAGDPKSHIYSYPIGLSSARITKGDLRHWITPEVFHDNTLAGETLIQVIPVCYYLDGEMVADPTNLYGNSLTIEVLLTKAADASVKNINLLMQRSQIKLERLVPSFMASSLACLTPEEKQVGAIVVDMGSGTLSWSLWIDGYFVQGGEVKGGGFEITEDIARAFSTTMESAEEIKIRHGSCLLSPLEASGHFDAKQIGEHSGESFAEFTKGELRQVIINRITYQLQKLVQELRKAEDYTKIKRIVLTGGGAQLPGISELVGEILQRQGHVRIGHPFFELNQKIIEQNPIWSTAIGLLNYGIQDDYPMIDQFLTKLPQKTLITRFIQWLRLVF